MRYVEVGAIVLATLLVPFMPGTAAAADGAEVVARSPREGDMARYEFNGTVLGLCHGDVWQTNVITPLAGDNVTVGWTTHDRQFWDGQTYKLAALERHFESQYCDQYEKEAEYLFAVSAELYGELPGPSFARYAANQHLYDHRYGPLYYVFGAEEMRFHESRCGGHAIGLVLGRTAGEARDALSACDGAPGFGSGLTTKWERDPTYGRTWVARFGSFAGGDGPGLLLRYSPDISMPVEIRSTSHRLADGRVVEENATMALKGWIDGSDALAPLLQGTPTLPSVPLVPWGSHGPETGDLEPFPVRQARQALSETKRGGIFFEAHPEARLQYARYSNDYPASHRAMHPSNVPEETDCHRRSAQQTVGGAAADAGDARWLATRWGDGVSYLYGHTLAPASTLDAGIYSGYSDPDKIEVGQDDVDVPDLGPRWDDLLAAEELVRNMGATGRLVVTVASPSLPAEAWATGINVHFEPWLPTHGSAFTGTVGVTSFCLATDDADIFGTDAGLAFVDGDLAYAWAITSDVSYNPGADLPSWDDPGAAFDASDSQATWFSAPWLGAAASIGLIGLLIIAIKNGLGSRITMAMFSRFQPAEAAGHPMRSEILAQVKAQPGIRLPALADALGEPRPTISYHVRMLERHDLVRVDRTWRGLVLHPSGHAGAAIAGVLNRANAREVLELLDQRPGSDVSTVATGLGVHKSRISRLARDLEDAGLITRERAGRTLLLSLSDQGRTALKGGGRRARGANLRRAGDPRAEPGGA